VLGAIALAVSVSVVATPGAVASAQPGTPSWWSGQCDANYWNAKAASMGWHGAGAHPLGASYLGIPVCGPRPEEDGAPDVLWKRPGWGELEFECVELAMRFMAQVYGVSPYGANGDNVVRNYTTADGGNLVKVANGTPNHPPVPGDVMSFDSPGLGHVAVVASSNVDRAGNGSIRLLSQNDTTDGWRTLTVSHWTVASFGSEVPYGWLHDPAGRGNQQQKTTGPGYWMVGHDGVVYAFGKVGEFGSSGAAADAIASRRDGAGYWLTDHSGDVTAFGTARTFGDPPPLGHPEDVTTISATPSGNGYWLFTDRGRVFAYGDAKSYGDMSGTKLNGPIVASAATASGHGYYMIGSDGGVFTFGDARFHGSTGAMALHRPVVGIAPTPDGHGYWLVASDGGVFAFGAPFRGSMGAAKLNQPVNGLIAFGNGYLMVASDGGVFDFSNQAFLGSLGGSTPTAPIVGIAAYGVG